MDNHEKHTEPLRFWREPDGTARFNFDHQWVKHSPTGTEWGYGGSGPADAALNALLVFTDRETAERLYQDFKDTFIAHIPNVGTTIPADIVRYWLQAKGATYIK